MSLKGFKNPNCYGSKENQKEFAAVHENYFSLPLKTSSKIGGKKQNRFYESFSDFNSSMLYVVYIYIYDYA